MEDLSITLVWLGFFACIFFGWYYYMNARNKERMALIEKNVDVSEIFKKREIQFSFPWLKLGMILIGIGIGFCITILITTMVHELKSLGDEIFIGSMLFFGGLGLVIAHYLDKPKASK